MTSRVACFRTLNSADICMLNENFLDLLQDLVFMFFKFFKCLFLGHFVSVRGGYDKSLLELRCL